VVEAIESLEKVIAESPDWWSPHWYLGKGQLALGKYTLTHQAFRRAYELEQEEEVVPRALAGICLELGKFDEAVTVAEQAVVLAPDNVGLIGNLAVAYLLAGRVREASKSIAAAVKLDSDDKINRHLHQLIAEVTDGGRPQPTSLASLSAPAKPKKRLWQFWKK
jgi:Flp pilus assembly protein TadD